MTLGREILGLSKIISNKEINVGIKFEPVSETSAKVSVTLGSETTTYNVEKRGENYEVIDSVPGMHKSIGSIRLGIGAAVTLAVLGVFVAFVGFGLFTVTGLVPVVAAFKAANLLGLANFLGIAGIAFGSSSAALLAQQGTALKTAQEIFELKA